MIGWLNMGSLVLGLAALILPVMTLSRVAKQAANNWIVFFIMISMSSGMISLLLQIANTYNRVVFEDWGTLTDIMGATTFISAVLVIVTIILNVVTLFVYLGKVVK